MKITVKDCFELEAFKPGILVSGKRNLDNIVRSVSVMDAADIKTAVKNNGVREQLVLTSFYSMKDKIQMQAQLVKELAACGVSGLVVFHVKNGVSAADSEIVESAEAAGLPIILIPHGSGVEYVDVIEQVMDKLLIGDSPKNNLINNTIYHLLDFEKHGGFPSALKEAALSNEFQVVLISKDFNPILVVETRHRTTVADAVRMLQKREDPEGKGIFSVLEVEGIVAYWGTINISDEKYFLLIVDNENHYSAAEVTKLAEIIELAMGMWKYTPERDLKAELIKSLTRGNKSLAYTLRDEMGLDSDGIVSVFYAKGIEGKECQNIIAEFEKRTKFEVLSITDQGETYGMILKSGKKERDSAEEKALCLDLFDRLKETGKMVRIFHVMGPNDIEGAADAYRLISETWTFVGSVFPYKRVFSKYELVMVSNCISIQVQGGYLKKNYLELLEPFKKEMGENKAKQLLDTLETFVLDAGMNSGKTSKIMSIHTNTVQYRLKRINEVLGVEITGNRVIPGLTIALAIKRLERAVN